jgi:DNA-binding MarR family transcriptional regulator
MPATQPQTRLSLLYDVHVVSRLSHRLVEDALADAELNGSEFAFYSLLAANGPLTPTEAAEWSATPLATTSKLLSRLEQRGHVVKVDNPNDARSTLVDLSDEGRRVQRAARGDFGEMLRRLQANLGNAAEDVQWAVDRLAEALRTTAETREAPSGAAPPSHHHMTYAGPPLTGDEEREVCGYISWVLWRRENL